MYLDRPKTRDLLLEYDVSIRPPRPRAAGLPVVYPWENLSLNIVAEQLYQLAANSGFDKPKDEFFANFGSYLQNKQVVYSNYEDFPITGAADVLYFATDQKALYYWDNEYKLVKATLVDDTIIYSGDASEYYSA